MYAILSGGTLLALCDKPRYIRKHARTGTYVETDKDNAIGISVCGELYNIDGKEDIPDAPQVIVTNSDMAEYVFDNRTQIAENKAASDAAIVETEDALCSLDEMYETRFTALEDVLCELDSLVSE